MSIVPKNVVADRWAGGSAIPVPKCPACASIDRSPHAARVFDYLEPNGPDLWSFWRCSGCQSIYPDPRPSADSIGAAYSKYYTHHSASPVQPAQGRVGLITALINGFMNSRFKADLSPARPAGSSFFRLVEPLRLKLDYHGRHLFLADRTVGRRVLDVGAGNGEFLQRAERLGWEAFGIDPDAAAVNACLAQGLRARQGFIEDELPGEGAPYDVITMRHSIEHVPDPRADLRHSYSKLAPGGMIWLAWPNPSGPGARFFKSTWRGLEAPRHLCIPSAQAMQKLLADAGFVDIKLLRRGHHARNIVKASATIATQRGGGVNRLRALVAPVIGYWADAAATFGCESGEELVMVAFVPTGRSPNA